MEKFRTYVELKEERLREALSVVSPETVLQYLTVKMFKNKRDGLERSLEESSVLLDQVLHSRLISALKKAGFPFYTGKMRELRNELFRENYGLVCKAVIRVVGSIQQELLSSAVVYFLEGLDNLRLPFTAKPQTYLFGYVVGRLKEEVARRKGGMTVLTYLRELCGYKNAQELLSSGKVFVNGRVIYDKNFRVRVEDEIIIDGEQRNLRPVPSLLKDEKRPEERLEREELWREVENKVGSLNAELLRRKFSGSSLKEIAEELGLPLAVVKSRIEYSLKKLRREVESFS